jgi:DNA-binding transcriptional MocR family regulator
MTERLIGAESLKRLLGPWRMASAGPLYGRLAAMMRLLILDGRLGLNVRLPGERSLAETLGVSRVTVATAYDRARAEGFLISRQGSGTVTALPCERSARGEIQDTGDPSGALDFAAAVIAATPSIFQAYAQALEMLPLHLADSGYETHGIDLLRRSIARRYATLGLPTTPDQIVISAGAQNGLALVLRALTQPGHRVALEHPSYPHAIDAIAKAHCAPVPFAMADTGWDVDGLAKTLHAGAVKLAYLIADHQNPTGQVMSAADRQRLIKAARSGDAFVVFDETIAELWFHQAPPSYDPRLDDPHVLRLGSLSKCFWGGLRIGWVRATPRLASAIVQSRASLDLGVAPLEQVTGAILLADHGDVIVQQRSLLAARQNHLRAALQRNLPEWSAPAALGGLSLWIGLPAARSTALVLAARDHGLKLAAGSRFTVQGGCENRLRLPFSRPEHELDAAVSRLVTSWQTAQAVRRPGPRALARLGDARPY